MTRAHLACRPTSRSWPYRPIRLSSIPSSAYGSTSRSASSRTGCMTTTTLSSMPPARLGGASPRRPAASNRSAATPGSRRSRFRVDGMRRGQMTVLDQEGIELADTVDAEMEAAQRAQQILNRGSLNGGSLNGKFLNGKFLNGQSASRGRIIVADDNWQTVFELAF